MLFFVENFHIIVPVATLIYNTTDHRALDTSPAHIHFGIKPDESVPDVYNLLSIGGYTSPNQYIKQKAKETREGLEALRYNPLSVDEDYFIPVRGSESGTDIVSLAGGSP